MTNAARLLLFAILAWLSAATAFAHEVRPAYLEIGERSDGRIDIVWKQPTRGEQAIRLRPRIEGGLTDRPPSQQAVFDNAAITRWLGVDLHGGTLDGRVVGIDGLDRTITDVLVVVRTRKGDQISQVLTPARLAFTIGMARGASVPAYLRLGVEHILTGVDHLLFVLGLILLSANLGVLVRTITAFTVAHSITLAASALDMIHFNPALIEALVALSILFLAVELVRKERGESGIAIRQPWVVAFGFGLLHGAAFASALSEIGLPPGNIPAALLLFNIGVEIGQLLFVGAVLLLILLATRLPWQPLTHAASRLLATYAIGGFSAYWFLERVQAVFLTT